MSLLVHELYNLNLALLIVFFNLPLIIISYFSVGKRFAIRTFLSVVFLGICLWLLPSVDITHDKLIVSIFGGVFLGVGIGLVMRAGAALDGIDLTIDAGETIAFVGPSGAGKTTIFQCLLRFYEPTSGEISINNQAINSLSLKSLRDNIAIVPQDAVIFSANALENIRYGKPSATDDEVIAAAKAALVDEFVHKLPDGYQTFLGERGTRLSGGQRQRIAIARAILKDAPILLLDEATSALDAESEILVQQGLQAAMRGRTTLMIAHRLSTIQKANRIIVLENGKIVETGSADALKKQGGLYARLAKLQLT